MPQVRRLSSVPSTELTWDERNPSSYLLDEGVTQRLRKAVEAAKAARERAAQQVQKPERERRDR